MFSHCIMFLLLIHHSGQNICTDLNNFKGINKRYMPFGNPLHSCGVNGILHCVVKCKYWTGCQYFAYHMRTQMCTFFPRYEVSASSLNKTDGKVLYSDIKDWIQTKDNVSDAVNKEAKEIIPGFHCSMLDNDYRKNFYNGTVNVTKSGKICQRWDSNKPHKHVFYGSIDSHFSNTGESRVSASNYCRMTTSGEVGVPWCYTLDPETRWETCNVTECTELGI